MPFKQLNCTLHPGSKCDYKKIPFTTIATIVKTFLAETFTNTHFFVEFFFLASDFESKDSSQIHHVVDI
jgi:hypothetical protein